MDKHSATQCTPNPIFKPFPNSILLTMLNDITINLDAFGAPQPQHLICHQVLPIPPQKHIFWNCLLCTVLVVVFLPLTVPSGLSPNHLPTVSGVTFLHYKADIATLLFIYFNFLFPQYIFFLLYSMVTQLRIHVYILFSHIIMFHHRWLALHFDKKTRDKFSAL